MSLKNFEARVISHKQEDVNSKIKNKKRKNGGDSCKRHRNTILNSILFMLFTTIAGACIMYYIQQNLVQLHNDINQEYNSIDSQTILETKRYIDAVSTSKLKDISNELTDNIYDNLDMVVLKSELESGIVSDDLETIFRKAILNKCTVAGLDKDINNIFVCNSKGILADYSKIYATDNESTRTWEVESARQQNVELFNNSIQSMIRQDVTTMFVEESVISDDENHKVVTRMTESELISIVEAEGLNGIKNYTFLVPVYIMENNDIFGTNDIIGGRRVANNKFILVQRYNLYDYIRLYHINEQFDHEATEYQFNTIFTLIYIFIIIYALSIIIFIIYSILVLNRAIDEQECNQPKNFGDRNAKITEIDPYTMTGRRAYDKYSAEIIRLLQEEREKESKEIAKQAFKTVKESENKTVVIDNDFKERAAAALVPPINDKK